MRKLGIAAVIAAALALAIPGSAGASDASRPNYDFNGDGASDPAVVRTAENGDLTWFALGSTPVTFGNETAGDIEVPADYDGDGRMDLAVYRPGTGASTWFIRSSATGAVVSVPFGDDAQNDIPFAGDVNGDGRADLIIYRPSAEPATPGPAPSTWFVQYSNGAGFISFQFGDTGNYNDQPVVADFNGDGRADVAVARANYDDFSMDWYFAFAGGGNAFAHYGTVGDTFLFNDYDGDGAADLTAVRGVYPIFGGNPNGAPLTWYVLSLKRGVFYPPFQFGNGYNENTNTEADTPTVGDYDGDGIDDVGVLRPDSNGIVHWIIWRSGSGQVTDTPYGNTSDYPVSEDGVLFPYFLFATNGKTAQQATSPWVAEASKARS